jgi:hypothetical protein
MNQQVAETMPAVPSKRCLWTVDSGTALVDRPLGLHGVIFEAATGVETAPQREEPYLTSPWLVISKEVSVRAASSSVKMTAWTERLEELPKNLAAIELLKSWCEGDEKEQHETMEFLKKALDEDRLSDRKLFP